MNIMLKGCPFCGSYADFVTKERCEPEIGMDFGLIKIECISCKCGTKSLDNCGKSKVELVKIWNKRT